jgi:hypothetical protein
LNAEQQVEFDNKMKEMAVRRKDQFFADTAKFKDTPEYRESIGKVEAEMGGGKNVDAWRQEKRQLDANKEAGKISQEQYDQKTAEVDEGIKKAKYARQLRKTIDEYVQKPDADKEKLINEYVKNQAGGKTEADWQAEEEKIRKKFDKLTNPNVNEAITNKQNETQRATKAQQLQNDPEKLDLEQKKYATDMAHAQQSKEMARQAKTDIQSVLEESWVKDTKDIYATKDNYGSRNERFIFHVTDDNTKSSIEEIWGVTDYREATVNGKQIFKQLDVNATNDTDCIINSCGKNKVEIVDISRRLAEDPACKMNAENAREFGQVINAVQQATGDVKNGQFDYNAIRERVNTMHQAAANVRLQDGQMEFTSINSLAVHAEKHKMEWGKTTTTQDYATDIAETIIKPENATGSVYTQNGQGVSTNYGLRDNGRYRFGVTTTNRTGEPGITTMFTQSTATGNGNVHNPGSGNATTLSAFTENMPWLSNFM